MRTDRSLSPWQRCELTENSKGIYDTHQVNAVNIGFRDAYEITGLIDLPLIQDFEFVTRGLFAA